MFNEFSIILNDLGKEQTEMQHDMQPDVMFLTAVSEMISSHQLTLASMEFNNKISDVYEFDGIDDAQNGVYLLFPDTIYNKVYSLYESRGELFPIGKNMLFKHLAKGRYIETETETSGRVRNTVKRNIAGKSQRVLVLKKSAIENINE